jgi:hypothetical protein
LDEEPNELVVVYPFITVRIDLTDECLSKELGHIQVLLSF